MPDTVCHRCGSAGRIRQERIVTSDTITLEYTCGHCNHTWRRIDERRMPDRRRNPRTTDRRKEHR